MNNYIIKILPDRKELFSSFDLDEYISAITDKIAKMYVCEIRKGPITHPTSGSIAEGRYPYIIQLKMKPYTLKPYASEIFGAIKDIHPLVLVDLVEERWFHTGSCDGIYWSNEGSTAYSDNSVYEDPNYEFHFMGNHDYKVHYVPTYIKHMDERNKERYKGMTYMWSCTGSWDNPLKADNIDDAIKEFEEYYYNMLWGCIESCRERLEKVTDNFRNFANYRLNNK